LFFLVLTFGGIFFSNCNFPTFCYLVAGNFIDESFFPGLVHFCVLSQFICGHWHKDKKESLWMHSSSIKFCLFLFLHQLNNPPAIICFLSNWPLLHYSAGCGANRFGASCEALCSKTKEHCRRIVLCRPKLGCNCASGLKGILCNTCEYWNEAFMLL
jgi:hypothetical protein